MHGEGKAADLRIRRIVQADDFGGVAVALVHRGEASHSFCWATSGGADGGDDVEESHNRRGVSWCTDCTCRKMGMLWVVCGIAQ